MKDIVDYFKSPPKDTNRKGELEDISNKQQHNGKANETDNDDLNKPSLDNLNLKEDANGTTQNKKLSKGKLKLKSKAKSDGK